jgi:hydroxyacyl-ACP dehydratase HTD2-like protein with hotdog domain
MSRLLRRLYSTGTTTTTPLPNAAETASLFLAQTASLPPRTHTQTLDLNQLHLLSSTLARAPPTSPTPAIPACHHLVYFTPSQPESALGADGTDTSYSPPAPFTRRMWAGGELTWAGRKNLLRAGQTVTETTAVRSAEGKRTRRGGEMVVVGVEKVLRNEGGQALVDRRFVLPSPSSKPPDASSCLLCTALWGK